LPNDQILPCYYSRQSIEQFFVTIKNKSDLLPLRTHAIDTFNGHVMISFIATIIYILIDKQLKNKKLSFKSGIHYLHRLHADDYKSKIIPKIPTKYANDILKAFKIKFSTTI
jgi:transposase